MPAFPELVLQLQSLRKPFVHLLHLFLQKRDLVRVRCRRRSGDGRRSLVRERRVFRALRGSWGLIGLGYVVYICDSILPNPARLFQFALRPLLHERQMRGQVVLSLACFMLHLSKLKLDAFKRGLHLPADGQNLAVADFDAQVPNGLNELAVIHEAADEGL